MCLDCYHKNPSYITPPSCNCFKLDDYNIEILDEDLKKDQYGKVIEDNKSRQSKPLKNFVIFYPHYIFSLVPTYLVHQYCLSLLQEKDLCTQESAKIFQTRKTVLVHHQDYGIYCLLLQDAARRSKWKI